jgi:outer membrane protein TolC
MKNIINTLILLTLISPVFSQNLDIEKCKRLALENSEDIKIAESKNSAAEYKRKEYRSNFFPKVSFNAT